MMRDALTRLLGAILAFVGAITLVFLALRITPGDPADNILGDEAPEAAKVRFRERLGLHQPLHVQYGQLWTQIADGTLGESYEVGSGRPVSQIIGEALPPTIELALAAMLVACFIAIPFGILAAVSHGKFIDQFTMFIALLGVAVPVFWSGPLLLFLFAVQWRIVPPPGAPLNGPLPLILPALVLGIALSAKLSRLVRAAVLDVLQEDYVLTARAKGLPERQIMLKHVLRNALIPVLTVTGLQLAALLSGAIVTEKVFARPGVGTLLLEAIVQRDYAVIQGCVIVITVAYIVVNVVVDIGYIIADPRVRRSR